jgi:hypothetical protein
VSDNFTLKHVAFIKSLGFNLLSIPQLLDEGFEVRFKLGASRIIDFRGNLVCMIVLEGQIFRAYFSRSFGPARCLVAGPSFELWGWHMILGHLSSDCSLV